MSNEDEQPRVTSHHLTLPTPIRHRSSQYLNLPRSPRRLWRHL